MAIINGRGIVGIRSGVAAGPSQPSIVTNGLVLNLDAGNVSSYPGTGTIWTDLSGNGNNGTLVNGPTYSSANNGSIVFDGVNDYTEFGDVLDLGTNNATINVWIKINTSLSSNKYFLSKSLAGPLLGRYAFGFTQTRQLRALVDGDGTPVTPNTNATLNLNQWYMCTMVINRASSVQLYINGVKQSVDSSDVISSSNGVNFQTNVPFRVGSYTAADNSSPFLPFPGNISNVQMYFRVLSDTEIQQNYNALKSRYGL